MSKTLEKRILREAKGLVGLQITGIRYITEAKRSPLFIDHRSVMEDGQAIAALLRSDH